MDALDAIKYAYTLGSALPYARDTADPGGAEAFTSLAEAWDEGYAARRSEDAHSPGESNPYRPH